MMLHPGAIAAVDPNRPAVIFGDDVMTYGQINRNSAQIAAMLHANGLVQGDVIAMLIGNRPEFFAVAWAAQRSGLYYVPISTRLTSSEIRYILKDCGAKALFVDPAYVETALAVIQGLDLTCHGLDVPQKTMTAAPAVEGSDMLYTSGTTGQPKGVRRPITGKPLGSETHRVARAEHLFGLGRDSIFLSPAPLYHAAPLRFSMNILRTGGCIVGLTKFSAIAALQAMDRHHVTHSQWVPTMFNRLLEVPEDARAKYNLSAHEIAIHAGSPCAHDVKRRMIDWWGPIVHEYYSGSESIGFTHVTSVEWLERPGSVGRPYDCAVHVVGDDGTPLGPGQTGLIFFEGKGDLTYHNDPVKTSQAHHARGWATLGDIGHVDADGYVFLTDRRAFTIISGGVNIYPSEIETAIGTHPMVRDIAVFGIPDDDMGEIVFAVIELVDGHSGDAATTDILTQYAGDKLAAYKIPRKIFFGNVGRTETGKIMKAELRARYAKAHCGIATRANHTLNRNIPCVSADTKRGQA